MPSATALIIFFTGVLLGAAIAMLVVAFMRRGGSGATDLGSVLEPLRNELERYDQRLTSFDRERAMQFGALSEQLHNMSAASEGLRDETQQLSTALRSPNVRGRWGEIQLKRVVELAGMAEHCDFDTQASFVAHNTDGDDRRGRPDLVVRLPNDRCVIVDSKAPLTAYLDAIKATDERDRTRLLRGHAAAVRGHVDALARKSYWELADSPTSDFVVLFLPGESFFAAALEHDAKLLDDAAARGVLIATPTTLIALLKNVAMGWRESRLAENAREISELAASLYERLGTLTGHFAELGTALDRAVLTYNRTVGSLESRVLVTARRFHDLGIPAREELEVLDPVDHRARSISDQ